jgi:hypothetical protein
MSGPSLTDDMDDDDDDDDDSAAAAVAGGRSESQSGRPLEQVYKIPPAQKSC